MVIATVAWPFAAGAFIWFKVLMLRSAYQVDQFGIYRNVNSPTDYMKSGEFDLAVRAIVYWWSGVFVIAYFVTMASLFVLWFASRRD